MDEALFNMSLLDEIKVDPFTDKQMVYVQDQQNGAYNGQITFDSSSITNSGLYQTWSEGYIQIPHVITIKSSVDASAANVINNFTLGLKNGHYNLIDSFSVDYNNLNVVQQQQFTNFYVNYKVLTNWSADDLKKWGPICGVSPDSATGFVYNAAVGLSGLGITNNRVQKVGSVLELSTLDRVNHGLKERMINTNFPLKTGNLGLSSIPTMDTTSLANEVAMSYYDDDAGAAAARVWRFYVVATIRLKDVSDFFDQICVVKGGFMKISISYNSSDCVIPVLSAADTFGLTSVNSRAGRTTPYILASGEGDNPLDAVGNLAGDPVLTITSGIAKSTDFTGSHPLLTACRLYVPCFKMDEASESSLLAASRMKEIEYTDFYNYNINNVSAGGTFNQILTNGLVDVQEVVVIPMINKSANGLGGSIESYQSPYDSCPGTTAPIASIGNFNVDISGSSVFMRNKQYDYEQFLDESSRTGLMGGVSTGSSSGLISYKDWKYGYRYYVADVGRRPEYENKRPKSVVVRGKNNSGVAMDYICFVSYRRKLVIDVLEGAVKKVEQ